MHLQQSHETVVSANCSNTFYSRSPRYEEEMSMIKERLKVS